MQSLLYDTEDTSCCQTTYLDNLLLQCRFCWQGRCITCHRVRCCLTAEEKADINRDITAHCGPCK